MKKIIDYLERLDFSKTEAKLYLILLKSGSLSVAELAHKADINRTAAYAHVNSLLKKGVISQARGSSSKVTANPPAQLEHLVEQKISSVNNLKDGLIDIVTLLNANFMRSQESRNSEIQYYKGKTNVKAIYAQGFKSNKIRSYFNPTDIELYFPENHKLFDKAFVNNPKLEMFEIVQNSSDAKERIEHSKNLRPYRHHWKILPEDIKLTANDILIFSGKVAIINIGDKENVSGVVLENQDYYNNSVQLFDLLWRLLPNP